MCQPDLFCGLTCRTNIRLSLAYILRCSVDWNVIGNVITKPKDFPLETKKYKSKGKWGFQPFGRTGYPFNFGVSVKTSSFTMMTVHDIGKAYNNKKKKKKKKKSVFPLT